MEYIELGKTKLSVSKLCFGALVFGPLQANLPIEEAADILCTAFEMGVNFVDTAELYGTYPHIKLAIKKSGITPVIASKCYAYSRESAKASLEKARKELDMDVIDIFMLHEQETRLTLRGHREALEYYIEAREKGIIKAVGVSTHNIEVVDACAEMNEIDVIHPLINISGLGIGDGSIEQMLTAVKKAHEAGKGIYSMKALGGGNLLFSYDKCMKFVMQLPYIDSIAMGMQTTEEVIMNVCVMNGQPIPPQIKQSVRKTKRSLHIDYWCEGCGKCLGRCTHGALQIKNGKAIVAREKCVLCSYCSSVCPMFAIKIK